MRTALSLVLVVVLVLVLVLEPPRSTLAQSADPDLQDLAVLEDLARRVEKEGFRRWAQGPDRGFEKKLAFQLQGNTVEKEKEFRRRWIEEYGAICAAYEGEFKEAKPKRGTDGARLLAAMGPRILEMRALARKPAEDETFAAREATLRKFLKRYDYGPKIAKASAQGTAVINVGIAPDIYEVVRRHVYAWKFQPLKDERGADVKAGKFRIEFTDRFLQNEVREALRMLSNEYFVVRYARMVNEQETDIIRITGAKLLLGTYYFLEHEDRLVVIRDPAPAR